MIRATPTFTATLAILAIPIAIAAAEGTPGATKTQAEPAGKPDLAAKALAAMDGAEEIVFVTRKLYDDWHYYANFGHWSSDAKLMKHSPDGSRLCKFNLRTRKATVLLDDPKGGFRDPRVHYDGNRLLFAYRKGGTKYYHLYESNLDGSGLKQLTSGDWDDVEPEYLPDGGIVFVSSRGKRFVPCYNTQVGQLFRIDADGGNLACLSANNVGDHRPAMLPDGRIVYTRWDYVDRAPQKFHGLWSMNPDGSDQTVLFGNTVSPAGDFYVMIDALPIPNTNQIVSVFSPGHGFRENAGYLTIVTPNAGPDAWESSHRIGPKVDLGRMGGYGGDVGYRDPYPLSPDCFLIADNKSLCIVDLQNHREEVYQADDMLHDPRVIRSRPREPQIASRCNPEQTTGRLVLCDVYQGRNMSGVQRGDIKKLLILEDLPKPVSYYSLEGAISMDGTHTLHRIVGTVPVEPDGSAAFELPALRAFFFVALDANGMAVKRMQSYTMVMPGETQGCVGCHEQRTQTGVLPGGNTLAALRRKPDTIEPIRDVPEVIDYVRDIQPIWDRHCVSCHNTDKPLGRVVLTNDRNEWFTQSYYALFAYNQISDTRRYDEDGNHVARNFGTAASPLMQKIDGSHHDAKLTSIELDTVRLWVEAGAVFAGTYAAYNRQSDAVSGALGNTTGVDIGKPLGPILKQRCLTCHGSFANLGRNVEKTRVSPLYVTSQANPWQGRVNLPRHCWNLYNLSHPEKSMVLLAPLAAEAGGYAWCKTKDGKPAEVFRDANDPDYRTILEAVRAAQARQAKIGLPGDPGWRPNDHYVRWMKRFGILPDSLDAAKDRIDPFETDLAYWQSLWHRPSPAPPTP